MNDIVVGVKPIKGGGVVEVGFEDTAQGAIGACWVKIDGQEIPGVIELAATYENGPLTVTLKLFASSLKTVHYKDPAHRPKGELAEFHEALNLG